MIIAVSLQSSMAGNELAAQSLQLQSQIFRSVIANYLSRPDDAAVDTGDSSSANASENETDSDRASPSTFDDSSIHLRVLRSAERRHHHPGQARNRQSSQHFPLHKTPNQLVEEFGEETMATIEVIQTRTPFNVTNGQLIMRDLPMVSA